MGGSKHLPVAQMRTRVGEGRFTAVSTQRAVCATMCSRLYFSSYDNRDGPCPPHVFPHVCKRTQPSGRQLRSSPRLCRAMGLCPEPLCRVPCSQPGEPRNLPFSSHTPSIKEIPQRDPGQESPGLKFLHLRWSCPCELQGGSGRCLEPAFPALARPIHPRPTAGHGCPLSAGKGQAHQCPTTGTRRSTSLASASPSSAQRP